MFQEKERSGANKCLTPKLLEWQCSYGLRPNQAFKLYRFRIVEAVLPLSSQGLLLLYIHAEARFDLLTM